MHKLLACRLLAAFLALGVNSASYAQSPSETKTSEPTNADALVLDLNESVFRLKVDVQTMFGQTHSGEIVVTEFKPNGNGPFPIAIFNHGRQVDSRAQPARHRFLQMSRYLVNRGFAVWIPTRLGYGESGLEPDVEFTGPCNNKNYGPAMQAASNQVLAVLEYAKKQSFTDPKRVIIAGQSMGGFTTVATAARQPIGLVAAINFAGGGGGDPVNRPGEPCEAFKIERAMSGFGATTKATSLWIYTENDRFFSPKNSQAWFKAFAESSTSAVTKPSFILMPAHGSDGHSLMATAFYKWQPILDKFLVEQGFNAPPTLIDAPSPTRYAAIDDASKLPGPESSTREAGYRRFLNIDVPKAFVASESGHWAYVRGPRAIELALANCAKNAAARGCKLYAANNDVVWK